MTATFSPDGTYLAATDINGLARVWDVATGKELRSFQGHTGFVRSVAFGPGGHTIASSGTDHTIKFWDVATGKEDENGKPFLTLSAHSGLRGLTFHYPDQDTTNVTPYPWMIRGAGEGVWLINLSSTLPYRMVDLATNKCDNHFVDYVAGNALQEAFRIGGGSNGGRVLNCQLNENYYTNTNRFANSPSRLPRGNTAGNDTYNYSKAHELAYVVGDCTNEILFQNFVFGANRGIDGMCFDTEGNLVATCGWELGGPGCRVAVFAPDGTVLEEHPVPAGRPTNCTFGDADLRTLYVTTIDGHLYQVKDTGRQGSLQPPQRRPWLPT